MDRDRTAWEAVRAAVGRLAATVGHLLHETVAWQILVRRSDRTFVRLPLLVVLVAAFAVPTGTLLVILAAVVFSWAFEVRRAATKTGPAASE